MWETDIYYLRDITPVLTEDWEDWSTSISTIYYISCIKAGAQSEN